jgi:hypothetical protein
MSSSAMNALLKYLSERIIVKETICNPCPRTVLTLVSGLYIHFEGEGRVRVTWV